MRIQKATHLGMCFGVRDAIEMALNHARLQPLTILGELVHNQTVLTRLKRRGIQTVRTPEEASTSNVMVTAHGASETVKARAREKGLNLTEATCPLVHFAHRAVGKIVREGYHPVIVGKKDHVEVRGMTGDLEDFDVVSTEEDIAELRERPRFGVLAQTTQPIDRVRRLASCIRERFPRSEVKFVDTVCRPTKERQFAAVELAQQSDIVIAIGGANSNNTRELVTSCARYCDHVYHVQSAEDLRREWFVGTERVGITAGTSTPDDAIQEVELRLKQMAGEFDAFGRVSKRSRRPDATRQLAVW